jgi:hypothetical protein
VNLKLDVTFIGVICDFFKKNMDKIISPTSQLFAKKQKPTQQIIFNKLLLILIHKIRIQKYMDN